MRNTVSWQRLQQALVAVIVVMAAASANAQRAGLYVGADLAQLQYQESGFETAKPLAIGFAAGNRFNPNFAAEVRIGTGVSDDTINVNGVDVKASIDNYAGIYAKGILPLNYLVELYGLVGYTHGRIEAQAFGQRQITSDTDFSYGLGAAFEIAYNMSIDIEWARLFEGSTYETDAIKLGLRFSF